ncbi:MAG TPA: hypothetical protein VHO06_27060 [Polyangia bacterium]|nr:hypothetical protein [Polyangia bacterium]
MLSTHYLAILALLLLSGCPTTNSEPPVVDSGPAGAQGTGGLAGGAGGAAEETKLPPPDAGNPGKPLAEGCAANSECASGFCVDGVCCNTACDGQCFNCNQTGTMGYCTAQTSGDDLNAAIPCTSPRTCGAPSTSLDVGGCRLKDAQSCKTAGDCASLNCQTFYADRDGDRYGDNNTTLMLCEETGAAAPGGYVTTGGDCCDSDIYAHPNTLGFYATPDACGSFDYNCDGIIEGKEYGTTYSDVSVSECGAKGSPMTCQ